MTLEDVDRTLRSWPCSKNICAQSPSFPSFPLSSFSFLSVSLAMTARERVAHDTDEETPLLRDEHPAHRKRHHSKIPWDQFTIILILQLAEPLTSQVIYPFAPEVRSAQFLALVRR